MSTGILGALGSLRCCRYLTPKIELLFATTRCSISLLFIGTFSRCPDIRVIFCHGGTLAQTADRIADLARPGLSEADLRAVERDNALRLLPQLAGK